MKMYGGSTTPCIPKLGKMGTSYSDGVSHCFPQSVQASVRIVPQIVHSVLCILRYSHHHKINHKPILVTSYNLYS
jgi:hypothetical protein